jgi:hypothetical protein
MLNTWDFVFLAGLALAALAGWRLKSLPLLGLGFAAALAPVAAGLWKHPLGAILVDSMGGRSLRPNQDQVAWWLILLLSGFALLLLFGGLSKMLAAVHLESLDRAFGAFLVGTIFLGLLSLNLGALEKRCGGDMRHSLQRSWSWSHLRASKEPAWVGAIQSLELPQKP